FGVSAQVEAVGEYKSAGDALRRTSMSKENREQIDAILDAQYAALVDAVAKGRRRSADETRAWIDAGPYRAERAAEVGLTDGVAYEDELARIVSATAKPARILRWEAYR